jgi:hypothetical protein
MTAVDDIERKKRLVRHLVRSGRGFAEQYGFPVTGNPSRLFQLLCLSVLLARGGDFRSAVSAGHALVEHGWDGAARLAGAEPGAVVGALRQAGRSADAVELAGVLGDLARTVRERYHGDLRRLRSAAAHRPDTERALLARLPGVDGEVLDLFLREVQALWPETAPVADRRALAAARRLGLGDSATDLARLAGGRVSERLAWLVGGLARTDLERRYTEVRQAAGASPVPRR